MSSLNVRNRLGSVVSLLEEWWVVNVGRFVVPAVLSALWSIKFLPHLTSFQNVIVS